MLYLEDEGIDAIDWLPTFTSPKPNRTPLGHYVPAPQTVQELSDALVQVWEEIPETLSVVS